MRGVRVMIIEDDAMIAFFLEELLVEVGHRVCAIERTQHGAIAAAASHQPQLIISDIRLKDGSGMEAVNAILEAGFVPHIFVSGDVIDRKILHPAAGILQKPFDERQLAAAIARAIAPEDRATSEHA